MRLRAFLTLALSVVSLHGFSGSAAALDYEDYPVVKLRTLDKITARTMTFEAKVGATMKFGEIFIKVQTCRKPPPVQKTEASAFLQIWETDSVKDQSRWIFSGWMFASSPTLSAMDHAVYDVWVIDCIGKDPEELPPPDAMTAEDEGVLPPAAQPALPPSGQLEENVEEVVPSSLSGSVPVDAPASADTAQETEAVFEETVPASNMPEDAAPVIAPAPPDTESGGGSDSFQGIY
jgi:hypothetical protein